ncbi:glutathione S-transferase family protein [Hoeflea sp.]|uniref:glutathione S-transferase family protein n=1 Tax=Hoeflea sp. TaxID=1940281 RepID=UPI003B02AE17
MTEEIALHGYRYSVYNRVARLALHLKDVSYAMVEVDPFSKLDPAYLQLHPFGRVPTLVHGTFSVFETRAITRYIDQAFSGPPLQPVGAKSLARMDQVTGIIDSHGYWPMVRQVFSQRVFSRLEGEPPNEDEIAAGLAASHNVLAVLDGIAEEGLVLDGRDFTLADCHLAPMIDYFVRADEGRDALSSYPNLYRWWERVSTMPVLESTDPKLPDPVS